MPGGRPLSGANVKPASHEGNGVDVAARDLEKKSRALDGAKKGYMEDSQRIIQKQQEAIDRLKSENSKLKESLDDVAHVDAAVPTSMEHGRIIHLKELVESYSRKIDIESRKIEEQHKDIDVSEAKVLENRLEKAQVKYNQLLSKNKTRRGEIEDLRKERITFENIYKKLESDLCDKKGELASKIEVSNIAYEARDQAVTEMGALRAQSDGEQTEFENEMARLGARLGIGKRERNAAIRQLLYSSVQSLSNLKRGEHEGAEGLLDNYEEAFGRLKEAPGGDGTPGEVVEHFLAKEDANLTLFTCVNELKQEKDRLEELKAEKEAELQQIKKQGAVGGESNQRKELMAELQSEHDKVQARVDAVMARNTEMVNIMQEMGDLVELVAQKVGATVPSRAGEGQPDDGVAGVVREGLGALEQRADEVVTMWNAFQASRSHGSAFHPSASGNIQQAAPVPTRPPGSGKLQIVAPTISGGSEAGSSDDSSDEDMPMTREQLKTKVLNKTGIAYEEFVSGLAKGANKPAGRQRPVSAAVSKRSSAAAASGHVPRRPVSARPRASPASASSKSSASGERVAVTSRATGTLSGTSSRASSAVGSRKKPPTSNWR